MNRQDGVAQKILIRPTGYLSAKLILAGLVLILSACNGSNYNGIPAPIVTIGGTVSGLTSGQSVTLLNSGANSTIVSANGAFTFSAPVANGGSYAVTIGTQPSQDICSVSNGTGSNLSGNVSNVTVTCALNAFTVGGAVTGLKTGTSVSLLNNGANATVVSANTTFTFSSPIADGGSYNVTVGVQPPGQSCVVAQGSSTAISANVSNVAVTCATATGSVLHSFSGGTSDGSNPYSLALMQASDGNFYGTTYYGGLYGKGVVFKMTPSGAESILWNFGQSSADGYYPASQLMQASDGNLYGMTYEGGTNNAGVLFRLTLAGTETVLHIFGGTGDGKFPGYYGPATLLQANDGNLYGVVSYGGGIGDQGIVFKLTQSGTYSILYTFGTNGGTSDGSNPFGGLIQASDGNLYGTTYEGGANNEGTIFKISLAGVESIVHSFNTSDGSEISAGLTIGRDGDLYGVATVGGSHSQGTFFKATTSGAFSLLYNFGDNANDPHYSWFTLILGSDGNFYDASTDGGTNGTGTIYSATPGGTVNVLYNFSTSGVSDGSYVLGLTIGSDGYFYTLSYTGGANNLGIIFRY